MGQLRSEFELQQAGGAVQEAWLYVSGIGYSAYELNGQPVFGDERLLDPTWTDYTRRVMFVAANVTGLLGSGPNCLGVWLGNGWFSQDQWIAPSRAEPTFVGPRVALSLMVTFVSGQQQTILSNASAFAARQGPITQDSVYHGEEFDMRKHDPLWSVVGNGQDFVTAPEVMPPPGGAFSLQTQPPVRLLQCAPPMSTENPLLNLHLLASTRQGAAAARDGRAALPSLRGTPSFSTGRRRGRLYQCGTCGQRRPLTASFFVAAATSFCRASQCTAFGTQSCATCRRAR